MIYVALLRGINVGGKNKVDMKLLKEVFEQAGMRSVETYINSGNVVFIAEGRTKAALTDLLERAIGERFGVPVPVTIRSLEEMGAIVDALPDEWSDDERMKSDVMFLWDDVMPSDVLAQVQIKPDVDQVICISGAVLWGVERSLVTRSRKTKLIGTDVYQRMTVRNVNTARKLYELMLARVQHSKHS